VGYIVQIPSCGVESIIAGLPFLGVIIRIGSRCLGAGPIWVCPLILGAPKSSIVSSFFALRLPELAGKYQIYIYVYSIHILIHFF